MRAIDEVEIRCPYCGELFLVQVETIGDDQDYVEDCEICCRPISLHVTRDQDGLLSVSVTGESE